MLRPQAKLQLFLETKKSKLSQFDQADGAEANGAEANGAEADDAEADDAKDLLWWSLIRSSKSSGPEGKSLHHHDD